MNPDDDIIELGPGDGAAAATLAAESTYGPYDKDNLPPLDFEAWAAASAALLERDAVERLAILESRQLAPPLWDACNQFWTMELARQIGMGNFGLATRYGAVCGDELGGRKPEAEAAPAAATPASESVEETGFLTQLPTDATLPFDQPAIAVPPVASNESSDDDAPPAAPPRSGTEETAFVEALHVDEPLPFKDEGDGSGD